MFVAALVVTLFAVLLYAVSTVMQAVAARRATVDGGRLHARHLAQQRVWWLSLVILFFAYLCSAFALRVLSLPTVQAIRLSYLAVTAILVSAVFHVRLNRREVAGTALTLGGLVSVSLLAHRRGASTATGLTSVLLALFLAMILAMAWLTRNSSRPGLRRGSVDAALAGCSYAVLDIGVRLLPAHLTASSVLGSPFTWTSAIAGLVGLHLFASAAAKAFVLTATAIQILFEMGVSVAWGAIALGDLLRGGLVLGVGAFALVGGGVILLADRQGAMASVLDEQRRADQVSLEECDKVP